MNSWYYSIKLFMGRYRLLLSFFYVIVGLTIVDIIAGILYTWFGPQNMTIDVSFAPEVWLSITALIVGTLVVIITIASQVVPRIIDVYLHDWRSLCYAWSLILCASHSVLSSKILPDRTSSLLLNVALLMPVCILLTFPYLYYILGYTKPNNIIRKIYNDSLSLIRELSTPRMRIWLRKDEKNIKFCQKELFKHLNQLDNIFHYVSFKELQAQIIINIGALLREYIQLKEHIIVPRFFSLSRSVMNDISFQTLEIQFQEIEESKTFYEQKCFRLLGDAYNKFLHDAAFDLASLCGSEMNLVGESAIQVEDEYLMGSILIRFNTMMRSAFKHGIANQEARNLYNLAFHYSTFIKLLALNNRTEYVRQAMWYLRNYGSEVFRNSQTQQTLYFINDVITFEMKEVLVLIAELQWDIELQKKLLLELLEMDNPLSNVTGGIKDRPTEQVFHSGVRTLQAGLALFYLSIKEYTLTQMIVKDISVDLVNLEPAKAITMIENICKRLESAVPTFWEDTDRGNNNIYYSHHKDQIPEFQFMLMESLQPKQSVDDHGLSEDDYKFLA